MSKRKPKPAQADAERTKPGEVCPGAMVGPLEVDPHDQQAPTKE